MNGCSAGRHDHDGSATSARLGVPRNPLPAAGACRTTAAAVVSPRHRRPRRCGVRRDRGHSHPSVRPHQASGQGGGMPAAPAARHGSGGDRPGRVEPTSLHGEFVVPDGAGGYNTVLTQTGTVTAISPTSITVRSEDGFSQTYVIPARLATRERRSPWMTRSSSARHATARPRRSPTSAIRSWTDPAGRRTEALRLREPVRRVRRQCRARYRGRRLGRRRRRRCGFAERDLRTLAELPGASLKTTVSAPIATSAAAPVPAATSLS